LNLTSNITSARRMSSDPYDLMTEHDRTLSFLPWAHSYAQTVELFMALSFGASIAICRGIPKILDDLQLVQPTILFAVPTLYKKVYDSVQQKMNENSSIQSTLLRTAIDMGKRNATYQRGESGGRPFNYIDSLKYSFLDTVILSKIRDRFGGRMRFGCVAGAACPVEVLHFMDAVGIPICEGYGLTETSPIITLNVPTNRSIGSVGQVLQDVTVYIIDPDGNVLAPGEEGEICCVGPNVMKGYHNNVEATNEVISIAPDGTSRM
jgi:long-chain acyl-CoA synthetase